MNPCEHKNIKEWDCGCMFGPPSCQSCHIRGKCLDCGRTLVYEPSKKTKILTGPSCDVCRQSFGGKSLLRQHRAAIHGWINNGRNPPNKSGEHRREETE